MFVRLTAKALVPIALFAAVPPAFAQSLENSEFRLGYSTEGVTSLNRVNDKYETDYIARGRTLGDVLIRYRDAGEQHWRKASAAMLGARNPGKGRGVSFEIGELVPTSASLAHASSSVRSPTIEALNDQLLPVNSLDSEVPRFLWFGRQGSTEWVQYDFPKPTEVRSVQLYWVLSADESLPAKLPRRWRLLYRIGDQWATVKSAGGFAAIADQVNNTHFEPLITPSLRIEVQLQDGATAGLFEWGINGEGRKVLPLRDLEARERFQLQDHSLEWTLFLKNRSNRELEMGDLALPLRFNTQYVWNKTETYTRRLIPHMLVAGGGSFVFWMRTNTEGPYLVMTPAAGCGFEYFEPLRPGGGVAYFLRSAARGEELRKKGGSWRLPNTKLVLKAQGQTGDSTECRFNFHWAEDYDAVRDVLYEEGLFDINVVPGMTVPTDLPVQVSFRTHNKIQSASPEFPESTRVEYRGERGIDVHVYEIRFAHLGENLLQIKYGNGYRLWLEFFVTEPLETLFKKRASFLVTHEQVKDPSKWYQTVFSQWDMQHQILRSPDDLDGLQSYAVASDDPALGKAPYVAGKNIIYPSQEEIDAVEAYIRKFVWGGLQQTDKEPYPYAIYGIPNWKVNRENPKDDPGGKKHLWRIYDYPHLILLYYDMYRLARLYPSMVHYLDARDYLERAFATAKAFFTVPLEIVQWSAYETGTYNELVIPDVIEALETEGYADPAAWLRAAWERKVKYFINDHPYLFGSEYPFDSTGFESTHAFARYAMQRVAKPGSPAALGLPADDFRKSVKYEDASIFLEQQMKLNLACRGWLETAYYYLGSDFRGSGPSSYTLSYMAQMGGWAISDYALYFARDPFPYLRLGYASYLSSWSLLNSGTAESSYGYWYPGKNNDGGAGGGFEPRPWGLAWLGNKEMGRGSWWYSGEIDLGFNGALRSAATIVAEDPIFGLLAYGGELHRENQNISVIPRDGLRTRFHIVRGNERVHLLLDRDGFAKDRPIYLDDTLAEFRFTVENRAEVRHEMLLGVAGLPHGTYRVTAQNRTVRQVIVSDDKEQKISIPVEAPTISVVISRVSPSPSSIPY